MTENVGIFVTTEVSFMNTPFGHWKMNHPRKTYEDFAKYMKDVRK